MSEILGKIGFDWHVALANLVNFLIILFVLRKFAWGPIGKILKERHEKIEMGVQNAKLNAEKLKLIEEEYKETMRKAHTEAQAIFEKTKKDAEAKKADILAQAQKEMQATLEQGRKIMEADKIKMVSDAKNEVAGLAMLATEKILAEK